MTAKKLNPKVLIIGLIFSFLIFFLLVTYFKRSEKTNVETKPSQASYGSVYPGITTEEEVIKNFGFPVKTTNEEGLKIAEYKGTNTNFNDQIYSENGKVAFVKKILSTENAKTAAGVKAERGDFDKVLYGPYSEVGFNLYVFTSQGYAYLGHKDKGLILEEWFFEPNLSTSQFISKFAIGYYESFTEVPEAREGSPDKPF